MEKLQQLLEQFHKEYEFLYNSPCYVAGYAEAIEWFDSMNSSSEKVYFTWRGEKYYLDDCLRF